MNKPLSQICFCPYLFWASTLTVLSIGWVTSSAEAQVGRIQPGPESSPSAVRDPTIPSAEIQRRTRPRPAVNSAARVNNNRTVPAPLRPTTIRATSGDSIVLQSLVQSSTDRCTATLRAGDQSVTVSFVRGQSQRQVELPATQFADFASTIQRLSGELKRVREEASRSAAEQRLAHSPDLATTSELPNDGIPNGEIASDPMEVAAKNAEAEMMQVEQAFMRQVTQPRTIDLASAFSLGGNLYQIIDFTQDTVLLEQVPLGKYLIVR